MYFKENEELFYICIEILRTNYQTIRYVCLKGVKKAIGDVTLRKEQVKVFRSAIFTLGI